MDNSDSDILSCLRRELLEEFGEVTPATFEIGEKLKEIQKTGTLHHFFRVRTDATNLVVAQPQEILESRFFTLTEIEDLRATGKLYFECEDDLYRAALAAP
jgi:8-oxo-dGTP pyrophosphatase MutT (NUDIX family)